MMKKSFRRHNNHRKIAALTQDHFDIVLCEGCKKIGYCRKLATERIAVQKRESAWKEPLLMPASFNLKYYTAKIPLHAPAGTRLNECSRKHLQIAYDAFHQDDFETALINYKCIDHGGSYNNEPDYFLALTCFMLHDYQTAALHMQMYIDNTYFSTEDYSPFLEECERRFSCQKDHKNHNDLSADLIKDDELIPVFTQEFNSHQL